MNPVQLTIWQLIFGISALHGYLIASILFFNKRSNQKANRILGALVFSISLILTNYTFSLIGVFEYMPHLVSATFPLWFIVGPLFYFYFRSLIAKAENFKTADLLHFLPLVICLLVMSPFYVSGGDEKLALIHGDGVSKVPYYQFMSLLYLYTLQTVVYIVLASRMLRAYEKFFKQQLADTIIVSIEWLRTLILILIIFLAIDFIVGTTMMITEVENDNYSYGSVIVIASFIYFIAYNLILNPGRIFPAVTYTNSNQISEAKYQSSVLEKNEIINIGMNLTLVMEKEKPFLNEELRLPDLADIIAVSPHQLSQVINQSFNQNFYNFVNQHRVKEVQERLADPKYEKNTILGIALEAGFNSSASFYRVFKQHTGQTPSQYLKNNKISSLDIN